MRSYCVLCCSVVDFMLKFNDDIHRLSSFKSLTTGKEVYNNHFFAHIGGVGFLIGFLFSKKNFITFFFIVFKILYTYFVILHFTDLLKHPFICIYSILISCIYCFLRQLQYSGTTYASSSYSGTVVC